MATTTLKVFSLEGRVLKLDTAEDIESHIKPLVDDEDVEEVRFLGNTLGVGASERLAKVLESKKKLQVANFADIFTGRLLAEIPQALDALLKSFLQLPKLHTVNLSDNAFGLNTQAPLVSFLSEHAPLEHLILNNNGLGPLAGTLIANALSKLAEKKKSANAAPLRTVICGRNRLENGSMEAWARAYEAHDRITHVKMVQNGIRQEGITLLLKKGLRHATGIQVLDLQDNTFTSTGARALSQVLPQWATIQELGVGDCLLGARGGVMLGEALASGKNTKLEVLRLQFNDFDAKGVKALADAQSHLPVLRRVELNGNKFEEDDVNVERIREGLNARREKAGPPLSEGEHEEWGMDELDELEEADSDEEEEEEEEDDDEQTGEEDEEAKKATPSTQDRILDQADQAENAPVAQEQSDDVDELADILKKTDI